MKSQADITKFEKQFNKISKKLFKDNGLCNLRYFVLNSVIASESITDEMYMIALSNVKEMFKTRVTIQNTLMSINYTRDENEWTEPVVVAFIDDIYKYYISENRLTDKSRNNLAERISKMYNVPKNRFKTQANKFLNNAYYKDDKYNLKTYFSKLEYIIYKYNDAEKLNSALENNELTEQDIELIKEIYNV